MRFLSIRRSGLLAFIVCSALSCSSKKDAFVPKPFSEYYPLQTGKYITYRIDSLVFTNFQRDVEIHSYQVKHVVDAAITDNLGRPSYRIYRFIRKADGSGEWDANGSYVITPLAGSIEVVEDNLRFIKLEAPIEEGFSWKGNRYLPSNPYNSFGYNFSNDDDMRLWDYYYTAPEPTFSYEGNDYNDVYSVEQVDEQSNVPVDDPQSYGYKTRSVDRYAKDIGLVFRQYELWEYQPNLSGPDPYYTGFGITMWMIDHN